MNGPVIALVFKFYTPAVSNLFDFPAIVFKGRQIGITLSVVRIVVGVVGIIMSCPEHTSLYHSHLPNLRCGYII